MKTTKQIVGVGLLTLVGTGFAMAQTPAPASSTLNWNNGKAGIQRMFEGKEGKGKKLGHEKRPQKHANKKVIHEAIIAGDFAKFVTLASSTPIGKIDQATFNSLSAQMKIIQAAKTQVDTILKAAGVDRPFHMGDKK